MTWFFLFRWEPAQLFDKQQNLKKSATRAVYFLSKLLFKPHPSPPLAHSRLRTPLSPKIEIKIRESESPTLNISQ